MSSGSRKLLRACSPAGSSVHRILQARILEWVARSFPSDKVWNEWSEVAQLCPTLCNPMEFPGKSTGKGCHFLLPRELLDYEKFTLKSTPFHMWQESNVPRRLNKNPGPFFPLRLLGQDTEDVPVCGVELLDKEGCHADSEAQTPRRAWISSLRKEGEKFRLPQHWNRQRR